MTLIKFLYVLLSKNQIGARFWPHEKKCFFYQVFEVKWRQYYFDRAKPSGQKNPIIWQWVRLLSHWEDALKILRFTLTDMKAKLAGQKKPRQMAKPVNKNELFDKRMAQSIRNFLIFT